LVKVICHHCGREVEVSARNTYCSACGKRVLLRKGDWFLSTKTTEHTLDQKYSWVSMNLDFSAWKTDLSKTEGDVWEWKVKVIKEPNKITGVTIMNQWWYEQFDNKSKSSHYEALIEALDQCEYEFKYMEDFRTITFYWHPMGNGKYYLILFNERAPHGDLTFNLTNNIYTQGRRWTGETGIHPNIVPTELSTKIS